MDGRELPLGRKAYTRIPHLPGSRTGASDRVASPAVARLCTVSARPGDVVVVQEKLDGSCVAVARLGGDVIALGREGWRAAHSGNPGRRMFARWVEVHRARFLALLGEGEYAVGEWLALAHATRYVLPHEPFVLLELFPEVGAPALATAALEERCQARFARPWTLHAGGAVDIATIEARLGEHGHHGAVERAEGAVWRVEARGSVVARAKYVRPGKRDGALLPENSGQPAVWNWTDGA